jgi:hypothetical protein
MSELIDTAAPSIDPYLALRTALRTRTSPFLMGDPGTQKTARIKHFCKRRGIKLITLTLALRDYQDIAGWPYKSNRVVTEERTGRQWRIMDYAPPDWAVDALTSKEPVCLFFDELTNARPDVQKLGHRILQDKNIADYLQLDAGNVCVIGAGNPCETGTDTSELSAPVANRLGHVSGVTCDWEDWVQGFATYWGADPEELQLGLAKVEDLQLTAEAWARARALIVGFIHRHPPMLHQLPKEIALRSGPWPSARTVDYASRALAAVMEDGLKPVEALPLMAMYAGTPWAVACCKWVEEQDLPSPEEILADPESINFDRYPRSDHQFTMVKSVSSAVAAKLTKQRFKAAMAFYRRLADAGAKDVASTGVKDLTDLWQTQKAKCPQVHEVARDMDPFIATLEAIGFLGKKPPRAANGQAVRTA